MVLWVIGGYRTHDLAERYGKQRSKAGYGIPVRIDFCAGCFGWAYYTPGDGKYIIPGGYIRTEEGIMKIGVEK